MSSRLNHPPAVSQVPVRRATGTDLDAVASLVSSERPPGQPPVSTSMLFRTPPVDTWFHDQLTSAPVVDVAVLDGDVVAAVAHAELSSGVAVVLFTSGEEHPAELAALLDVTVPPDVPAVAYAFAPAHTAGLEGLAVSCSPNTHRVLCDAGFMADDLWSYQRCELPGAGSADTALFEKFTERVDDEQGHLVATVEFALVSDDPCIGVGWWLGVVTERRGEGWGRAALELARQRLTDLGATEMILFVDDDPQDPLLRSAALGLYRSTGFVEVSRLWSYRRGLDVYPW